MNGIVGTSETIRGATYINIIYLKINYIHISWRYSPALNENLMVLRYFSFTNIQSIFIDFTVVNICFLPITTIQKDIIVGTLLGDASMERNKPTHNARLRFDQTYPKHECYLISIYIILKNLTGPMGIPKIHIRKPDKRTGKVYITIAFKTRSLCTLNYFYDLFYKYDNCGKRHKVVPNIIGELLSPVALAYWIIDDGGINAYGSTLLNTDRFRLSDIHKLQQALFNNFGLRTRLQNKRKNQWMIVIPIRQTVRLFDIVSIHMHPSITYKVKKLQ